MQLPSRHKIITFLCAFTMCAVFAPAQNKNLVYNPGFETETDPPILSWPQSSSPGSELLPGWSTPTRATPDYYNSAISLCDGAPVCLAKNGQGRCAFICGLTHPLPGVSNYKEYVQGEFTSPLVAGEEYSVSFYVALDRSSTLTSTGIGAYISKERILADNREALQVQPQVISHRHILAGDGWVKISGNFRAGGGEQFITIGSFSDTAGVSFPVADTTQNFVMYTSPHIQPNAYFYLDDVCVSPAGDGSCSCQAKIANEPKDDYFLFVLDVSGSMNKQGKLRLMKRQIRGFPGYLGNENRIGVMTFAEKTGMLLPFCSPGEKQNISTSVDSIKAKGGTNGDLALRTLAGLADSLHGSVHVHIIFATDGIFNLQQNTKSRADSCFLHNGVSFCVLQFGNRENRDLQMLAGNAPGGSYNFAHHYNVGMILKNESRKQETVILSATRYTDLTKAAENPFIKVMLAQRWGNKQ